MTTVNATTSVGNSLGNSASNALTQGGNSLIDQLMQAIGIGGDPVAAANAYLAAMQGANIQGVGAYNKDAAQTTPMDPVTAYLLSNPALAAANPEQAQAILQSEGNLGKIADTGVSDADAAQIAYNNQNEQNQAANATTAAENAAATRGQGSALSTLLLGQAGRNAADQQGNAADVSNLQAAQARRLQAQGELGQLASATQGQDIGLSTTNAGAANQFAANNQAAANTVAMNNQQQGNLVNLNNTNQSNLVSLANQKASQNADTQNAADQLKQLQLIADAYGGNNGVVKTQAAQGSANANNSLFGGSSGGLIGAASKGIGSLFGGNNSSSSSGGLGGSSGSDPWSAINDPNAANIDTSSWAAPDIPDLTNDIPSFDIAGDTSGIGDLANDASDFFDI